MQQENFYQLFLNSNPNPRQLLTYEGELSSVYIKQNEKSYLNFSSNDYLGLAKHPLLTARTRDYAKQYGVGSASSRLVAGNYAIFNALEAELAKSLNKPAALILGAGYQTNFSVLECLLDNKVLGQKPIVYCDKWCHASIISSIRHFATVKRYQHNNLTHLKKLLTLDAAVNNPKFIIAESLYSMDGDQTDLTAISVLAKQFKAMLYVDDAHTVGIAGNSGWGKASDHSTEIDIIMGTFSKGLGSFGGYIGCTEVVKNYLVNKCRGLIYSTALPFPILGAISAAMELIPQLTLERQQLAGNTQKLLTFFQQNHLNCGKSTSHIIPWIIGDAKKTLAVSEALKNQGILAVTIRPPSVPVGQSRIRFCLSAAHQDQHIDELMDAIMKVKELL